MCYMMKCEWLKNESNYFVTCKYFRLIVQPLQTVTFAPFRRVTHMARDP